MKARYLLHVGFPKTASTWLQYYLQESTRINYIGKHAGRERWQSEEIKSVRSSLQGLKVPYSHAEVDQIIHATIKVDPNLPIVLSDEVLAKPWKDNDDWAAEFSKLLFEYFPGGKVLLTVRRQSDIACSLYRKYVEKNGMNSLSMAQWFESGAGSQDVDFWRRWNLLNYYKGLIQFFDDEITVLPYEMMKLSKGEYCSEITDFFDIKDVDVTVKKQINQVSFKTDYVQVLKLMSRPKYWKNVKESIKVKPKYDSRLIESINDHFAQSNHEFAQMVGIDLKSYDYY